MASVRLLNCTPYLCGSLTRLTRCSTLRPSWFPDDQRVSFRQGFLRFGQTRPSRSARLPLTLSAKTFLRPALA